MEPSLAVSLAGLAFTLFAGPSYAYKYQELEGSKLCDFSNIQVLQKNDQKIYLKYEQTVFVMYQKPTNKGVKNVKRFETTNGGVVFLQLPEKAMLLDNVRMKPILNECKNI